jgi:hypothetical protein
MTDAKRPQEWDGWKWLLVGLLAVLLLASSCSPRIIEHTTIQRDTLYRVRVDSVRFYDRDSIYIREKGDTVYKYVEKWRWRDRLRVDTVRVVRVDSVAVERVKEVEVPATLTKWQRAKMGAFWGLLGAVLLLLAWTLRKPILKLLKICVTS